MKSEPIEARLPNAEDQAVARTAAAEAQARRYIGRVRLFGVFAVLTLEVWPNGQLQAAYHYKKEIISEMKEGF